MSANTIPFNEICRSEDMFATHSEDEKSIQSLHCKLWLKSLGYPTQCVRFLRHVGNDTRSYDTGQSNENGNPVAQARLALKIVIVGAGVAGLATAIALSRRGHSVVVLEQAPELGEVGAGIQIPPNSGLLLRRWGVEKHLQRYIVQPEDMNIRRWQNGDVIGRTRLGQSFQADFDIPYYVVHRAHLHKALCVRAEELGVKIELGKTVITYDPHNGSVSLAGGLTVSGDLIIAADGIKSKARATMYPRLNYEPEFEGFAVYRATLQAEKMKNDPDLAWLLNRPNVNIWIGEKRHIMAYQITAGQSFNMVLSHVDHSDPATWTTKSFSKEHVSEEFCGWDPKITKAISLIDSCLKWPLRSGRKLPSWSSSKLLIIGDAAHAMLPYMSQGAAMAVEDGGALATVLNHIGNVEELPFVLSVFEKERIKRTGDMMDASALNGIIWHFADGPEQRARDASMEAEVSGLAHSSSANQWNDPTTYWWAYGYDAEQVMEEAWKEAVGKRTGQVEC